MQYVVENDAGASISGLLIPTEMCYCPFKCGGMPCCYCAGNPVLTRKGPKMAEYSRGG